MTIEALSALLTRPDVQRKVVGAYPFPFALGVVVVGAGQVCLKLSVVDDTHDFPKSVTLEGEDIRVVVETGWLPPVALG